MMVDRSPKSGNQNSPADRPTVTQSMIDSSAAKYPIVTLTDGTQHPVDRIGLLIVGRREPIAPPPRQRIVTSLVLWMEDRLQPIRTPSVGSGSMKHAGEKWIGEHVYQGELLAAAAVFGLRMRLPEGCLETPKGCKIAVSKPAYMKLPEVLSSMEARA